MPGYYTSPLEDLYRHPRAPSLLSQTPELSPQQEESTLSKIVGTGLTGLQWVGNLLDKTFGGRAIRGALGGKSKELLSVLPLSDTLGLTDIRDRVSGEDLLHSAGIKTGTDWGDTALGIATEIGLDPSTYLSLGGAALTKAGAAAKKAGQLAPTWAGRIRAGQQGLAGFGVPPLLGLLGADVAPSVVLGTGERSAKLAEKMGLAGNKLLYSGLGRVGSANFDPAVQGTTHALLQQEFRSPEFASRLAGMTTGDRELIAEAIQQLHRHNIPEEQLWHALESVGGSGSQEVDSVISRLRGTLDTRLEAMRKAGIPVSQAQSAGRIEGGLPSILSDLPENQLGYIPRDVVGDPYAAQGMTRHLKPTSGHFQARESMLQGIPVGSTGIGGTGALKQMAVDPDILNAVNDLAAADVIVRKYGSPSWFTPHGPGPIPAAPIQAELGAFQEKASKLAPYLRGLTEEQRRLYAHPVESLMNYLSETGRATTNAESFQNALMKSIEPTQLGAQTPGRVTLQQAIENMGIPGEMGQAELMGRLQNLGLLPIGQQVQEPLGRFTVPEGLVEAAQGVNKRFYPSNALQEPLAGLDSATLLNKAFVTAMWPAHNIRNFISDLFSSTSKGGSIPGLTEGIQIRNAMRSGTPVPGLANRLAQAKAGSFASDAEATDWLGRQLFAHSPVGSGSAYESAGAALSGLSDQNRMAVPGLTQEGGLADAFKSYIFGRNASGAAQDTLLERMNPTELGGFGGFLGVPKREVTKFGPAVAGQKIAHLEDAATRDATFIERLLKGFNPSEAGKAATEAHFDYSRLTNTERDYLRRIAPFYSWSRFNVPSVIRDISRQPGGLYGASIRTGADVRNEDQFLPESMNRGLTVPLGDEQGGVRSYLTSLGLPFEDVTRLAPVGPSPVKDTLAELAGNLNPLIKAPLEYVTGRSLYSGRELTDRGARVTGNSLLDQLLSATPASRVVSTGANLAGPGGVPEKLLNLLTGARVSDVEVEKAKRFAILDALRKEMMNNPDFQQSVDYYVKPENQANLSPDELALLKLFGQVKKR